MTDIEKKALELVNEMEEQLNLAQRTTELGDGFMTMCLRRAIEQHEAFRQEVSDALVDYFGEHLVGEDGGDVLTRFIIDKPDPLVEVLTEISGEGGFDNYDHYAHRIRSTLEARGLEIIEINKEQN